MWTKQTRAEDEDFTERKSGGQWREEHSQQAGKVAKDSKMGPLATAIIACLGLLAGWAAIEIACKPCLDTGRAALDRSLNPDYDPDDELPAGGSQGPYTEAPGKKDEEDEVDEEKPLKGGASKSES